MVKALLLLLMVFAGPTRADEIPEPRAWFNELPDALWLNTPGLIRNIAVIGENDARSRRWNKNFKDFSSLGFLQSIESDALDFGRKLNPEHEVDMVRDHANLLPIDLLLRDEGSQAAVQVRGDAGFKAMGRWGIGRSDRQSSQTVLDWLVRKFGYDAVVLDSRNGWILIALLQNSPELGQGLVVRNSSKRWFLKSDRLQGEALLQILKVDGALAVCEMLLAGSTQTSITPGAKILLGQKRNIDGMMKAGANPATPPP